MGECFISRRGGESKKLPVLNANYPSDITINDNQSVPTFTIMIQEHGKPSKYTYQWYVNGEAVPGETEPSFTKTELPTKGTYTVFCVVKNSAGTVTSRTAILNIDMLPSYSFDNSHTMLDDGNGNWRIKFYSSGYFTPKRDMKVDVYIVGAGGGGVQGREGVWEGPSGAGGKTTTGRGIQLTANQSYYIQIGAGGSAAVKGYTATGGTGGTSSAFNYSATGGGGGYAQSHDIGHGGDGGSGGAAWTGSGGTDGGNGSGTLVYSWRHGYGQGTTTRAFGDSNGELYASGGSFGSTSINHGGSNTGNGGSGGGSQKETYGGNGGSGIVIIRNAR